LESGCFVEFNLFLNKVCIDQDLEFLIPQFLKNRKEDIERLEIIHRNIEALIKEFEPEQMAVEELFFNKNVKTAIAVGQARGVILLAGSQAGLKVAEYTPLQIKQAVVGYGRADKMQVQQMVKSLLNLSEIPRPDDAADALAISICHGHVYSAHSGWEERL
jgi:crossover junction endodeoxyribonuclease RuvC